MSVERELCIENLDDEPPLQQELTLGKSYRAIKREQPTAPITPKRSPINMPYQLCTALQRMKRTKKKKKKCQCPVVNKISLLERSALPQLDYMELLSVPHCYPKEKPKKKKKKLCCRCKLTPLCRPRLIQMAIPKKRYVWENWKTYQNFLPAEMLVRFDQILKSGDNLDLNIARCYFKNLEKKKRRELKRKRMLRKKKKKEARKGETWWIKKEVDCMAECIVKYIEHEPLFVLNFQQMMTSNELLGFFTAKRIFTVRKRTTHNVYKRTLIEISDKVIKWMDYVYWQAELKPLNSREELGPIRIPSIESLTEEEIEEISEEEEEAGELGYEEEFEEGEGEGEGEESGIPAQEIEGEEAGITEIEGLEDAFLKTGADDADGAGRAGQLGEDEQFEAKKLLDKMALFARDEEDEGGDFIDIFGKLDEDILEKLIQILSQSSPEFLDSEIDPNLMPGVTYGLILEKLKQIRDGRLMGEGGKPFLEDIMVAWAKKNDPERVDSKILDKIHETSRLLGDFFNFASDLGQLGKDGRKDGDEDAEGKGGEAGADDEYGEGGKGGLYDEYVYGEEGEGLDFGEEAEGLFLGEEEEEYGLGESEEEEEGEEVEPGKGEGEEEAGEGDRLKDGRYVIKGHKPPVVYEHTPGTICCLSLKIWSYWLVEVAENAHKWTQWMGDIIKQVRHFAAKIRGDVQGPSGKPEVVYKKEWRKFVKDTEEKVVTWRQYSKHVKDLSEEIMENFHGKPVNCCPKCLQDNLIPDVVMAHETLEALTEAIMCAAYWQRCLDKIVEETRKLTEMEGLMSDTDESQTDLDTYSVVEIEELSRMPPPAQPSEESVLEIEELVMFGEPPPVFEILELAPRPKPHIYEVELLHEEPQPPETDVKSKSKKKKGKKDKKKKKK